MKAWKRWKTILVTTIVALGAAALLLPATSFGWGSEETGEEHWIITQASIDKQNEGYCTNPSQPQCFQKCIDFQGAEHQMPYFECF